MPKITTDERIGPLPWHIHSFIYTYYLFASHVDNRMNCFLCQGNSPFQLFETQSQYAHSCKSGLLRPTQRFGFQGTRQ